MNTKIILGSLALIGLVACSSTAKRPDWVDNPSSDHPQKQYLSAVGDAENREIAAERARANLAKIFEVAVQDSSMDFSLAAVETSNGESQVSNTQLAGRYVAAFADQVLQGVKVVEYWEDEDGINHSLAVLEKAPAARRFREQVRNLDRAAEQAVTFAEKEAGNPVAALTALEEARKSQLERDALNRNLVIVAGKGLNAANSAETLAQKIKSALALLQFEVAADEPQMKQALQGAVAALGIQSNVSSAYVLSGKLDMEPIERKTRWYWMGGSLELSLEKSGEVLAKQRWPLKVSATEEGMVMQRAKDQLANGMPRKLYELLTTASPK